MLRLSWSAGWIPGSASTIMAWRGTITRLNNVDFFVRTFLPPVEGISQ